VLSEAEAEAKGNEFREAMRQDADKSGIPGKLEGGPESRFGSAAVGEEPAGAGRKMGSGGEKGNPALSSPCSGDALLLGLGGSYVPLETQAAAPSSTLGALPDASALAAELAGGQAADGAGKSLASEAPAPRPSSGLSVTEAEGNGNEFRAAMRQDAEKSGIPGKLEGELASRFGSETDGDEAAEAGRKIGAREGKTDPALPPPFSGDALLHSLGVSYAPLETQAAPFIAPNAPPDAAALAAELAERILVNTDNRAAGGEVRVTLKDSVLPDTEIILRQEGERLVVQLVSGNSASLDALRLAREDLHGKLLDPDRDVSVEVLDKREQESGDSGHSGRRSRGLDYFSESER
jgi:hypothetical protein